MVPLIILYIKMLSIFQTGIKHSLICKRPPRIFANADLLKICTNNFVSTNVLPKSVADNVIKQNKKANSVTMRNRISKKILGYLEDQELDEKLPMANQSLLQAESVRFMNFCLFKFFILQQF